MQDIATVDRVIPGERWTFDEGVTACFDDMLRRSIPGYSDMRRLVFELGSKFVQFKTHIVDLGCSRGEAMAPFVKRFGAHNRYVAVETSGSMLEATWERFQGMIDVGIVEVRDEDLRRAYPPARASLTLCVLTLQFIPIEHRPRVLRDAFDATLPGGAFILVEKVLGASESIDAALVLEHLAVKKANGYSTDAIEAKRRSLEHVMVPLTAAWNEQFLKGAGFSQVDCFWRNLNFAGWLAIKGK
jgi:tRNA (cmo5U34)-methyltransferase